MDNNKKVLIYASVGLLSLAIIYCSTRKPILVEVSEIKDVQAFDNSALPSHLKPPFRMADGEPLPELKVKKALTGIIFKPRFDQ